MKNIFLFIAGILFCQFKCFCQTDTISAPDLIGRMFEPDIDFFEVLDQANEFYRNHPDIDTFENAGFMQLKRIEWFWKERAAGVDSTKRGNIRSEEHTSELQSQFQLVCR